MMSSVPEAQSNSRMSHSEVITIYYQDVMESLSMLEATGPFANVPTQDDAVAARIEDHLNNVVNQYPEIIEMELVAQRLKRLNMHFVDILPDREFASQRIIKDLRYLGRRGMNTVVKQPTNVPPCVPMRKMG